MSANLNTSAIAEYFKGKSIFITGATGFIGKQLVEKLVRSCPGKKSIIENHVDRSLFVYCLDLQHIYILVRSKRGRQPDERLKNLIESPVSKTRYALELLVVIASININRCFYSCSTQFDRTIRIFMRNSLHCMATYSSRILV
jgi:hypothetical protein